MWGDFWQGQSEKVRLPPSPRRPASPWWAFGGAHRYVAAGRFQWVVAGKALNSRVWAFPLCPRCPQKSWHCIIMRWVNLFFLSHSSSRIKRTGYTSSEPWNQLGSFKNQCRDLSQAQWIRVATVEPGILLWSHSLCYSFAAGPSAVCRQVFRSPWTRSFLRSTSALTSCESCQNACTAVLFLGNVIFGWGWKGLEREKGRDTLGRTGRDRCVGQGLKGLRKRFWEGWGQWQRTCCWGPGASGPSHGGRRHDPSPSGSAAAGQEKGRLFGKGIQEEGPCSMSSGMRAVLGQVYAGGQWGGQLELWPTGTRKLERSTSNWKVPWAVAGEVDTDQMGMDSACWGRFWALFWRWWDFEMGSDKHFIAIILAKTRQRQMEHFLIFAWVQWDTVFLYTAETLSGCWNEMPHEMKHWPLTDSERLWLGVT